MAYSPLYDSNNSEEAKKSCIPPDLIYDRNKKILSV
jgi:hypothetical protein